MVQPDQLPPDPDAIEAIARATVEAPPPAFRAHLGDVVPIVEECAGMHALEEAAGEEAARDA